jgi:hypothetical protein
VCIVKTRKQSAEENAWTPWNNGYSRKELQSIQKDDPAIGPILRWKECSSRLDRVELVKDSPATRHYWYRFSLVFFFPMCPDITESCIFLRISFLSEDEQ